MYIMKRKTNKKKAVIIKRSLYWLLVCFGTWFVMKKLGTFTANGNSFEDIILSFSIAFAGSAFEADILDAITFRFGNCCVGIGLLGKGCHCAVGESVLYNTDTETGAIIAQLKNINENLGSNQGRNGVSESVGYNTDTATGEIIAQLKNLNDTLGNEQIYCGIAESVGYNTDTATGEIIAQLKNLNSNSQQQLSNTNAATSVNNRDFLHYDPVSSIGTFLNEVNEFNSRHNDK